MSTSGSIDFTVTTDEIITEALELLGVLGEGETPTADQITSSRRTLNMLAKNWQAQGLNLFAVQRNYLFLTEDQKEYSLSSTSSSNFTSSFVQTTTLASAVATDTTIDVTSISGISNADKIGIYTIDGTLFWTTVNGAPAGDTVTLTNALTSNVDEGAVVYVYTAKANRPMLVLEAYLRQFNSTDIPVSIKSRTEYYELSQKSSKGFINQVYYDPQINTGTLFVWPTTQDERDYLILLTQRTLDDFDNSSDTPDFPQEWYMPLALNLARTLAPKYGTPQMDYARIMQLARESFETAREFDTEMATSVYLQPNSWGEY